MQVKNIKLQVYKSNGSPIEGLVLHKPTFESTVMSLDDKITGDAVYKSNDLQLTMGEYVLYEGVKYGLVNPPTIVKEGLVGDNSGLNGMTKYSFEFYHPMYILFNLPFSDVAVSTDESADKSYDKTFSWIGTIIDFIAKLNKNLAGTQWTVDIEDSVSEDDRKKLSEVVSFDKTTIADALKTGYETFAQPFVVSSLSENDERYSLGKRFLITYGHPSNEIYSIGPNGNLSDTPFVFRFGQGLGLKNDSRTPKNNKIITRLSGYGSETNVPYDYPQIKWTGDQTWKYTINNAAGMQEVTLPSGRIVMAMSYPIYDGIVGGQPTKLIKHPFTRKHLMPPVYVNRVAIKVNPLNPNFNPDADIIDYYEARSDDEEYPNPIDYSRPSYEIHEFEDIKPELGEDYTLYDVKPLNQDGTIADDWDDTVTNDGEFKQSNFQLTLPVLNFDMYASAAVTEEMKINMRSGACLGCTFEVQIDWEDYKNNFYTAEGEFQPDGPRRNLTKYPKSNEERISVIVHKENETFGTVMPNIYRQPKGDATQGEGKGDKFVILGISMPTSYISSAQDRLADAMKEYLKTNNEYYYEYPLKFDEYFFFKNEAILEQIHNNTKLRFMFANEEKELYVKQISVSYGENPLPTFNITLTDEIEVVQNQLGQTIDAVSKLEQSVENSTYKAIGDINTLSRMITGINNDTSVINYLRQALAQDTQLQGGLLLTTLIALRDANYKVWSGINGAYDSEQTSGGIAAWYGGGMIDHEVQPTLDNYAKSLFRFDGSGYLAGGNITWDIYGGLGISGFIFKKKTIIHANNLSYYCKTVAEEDGKYLITLDLSKCGAWVEFNLSHFVLLTLPSIDGTKTSGQQSMEEARSVVGNTLLLYSANGAVNVSGNGLSFESIKQGYFLCVTCKMRTVQGQTRADGFIEAVEDIYWEVNGSGHTRENLRENLIN